MGVLVDDRRILAASSSLDQIYPLVRSLYRTDVDDRAVEAASIFLYTRAAQRVFGRRFVERMGDLIADRLKYATPPDTKERVERLQRLAEHYEQGVDELLEPGTQRTEYEHLVRSLIRALLSDAGLAADDPEVVRNAFVTLEGILEQIRAQLEAIRSENSFLL